MTARKVARPKLRTWYGSCCALLFSMNSRWRAAKRGLVVVLLVMPLSTAIMAGWLAHRVLFDRSGTPDLDAFMRAEQPTTGEIYAADGALLIELARQHREVADYAAIPAVVRDAILAAEDKNFLAHRGIDPAAWPRVLLRNMGALERAARRALASGERLRVTFRQGGSTITQQLVRGYFLTDLTRRENGDVPLSDTWLARLVAHAVGVPAANKLVRKVEEIRLALWLEQTLTARLGSRRQAKEMIFARYASMVYLGSGRYGVAAASRYYFDKPLDHFRDADVAEAALLAGIIKNPRDYAPTARNADPAWRRRNDILARMVRGGRLDAAAAQRAALQPITVASPQPNERHAPAAVASVLDELRHDGSGFAVEDLLHGRVRVYTSIDSRVQRIAEDAVETGLLRYERRRRVNAGATQAAVVVLRNADGAVLAEVGGRRFYQGRDARYTDYNRASQALRQPGSAFKPLVYLTAFRAGASLETLVRDEPIDVLPVAAGGAIKSIANYDGTFRGPIRIREALAESRNAATVWVAQEVGMPGIIRTARELGIRTPLQPYLSTALGASEVTLRELANCYRALASSVAAQPRVIERLENGRGERLFETSDRGRRFDMPELPMIQEGLRGVVRLPGGTAHALADRGFAVQVIGKTGTSSDFRDAVFVGSTYGSGGITVAVWVGRDDFQPLGHGETGGRVALPIFREIMSRVYAGDVLGPAPRLPENIDRGIDAYLAWTALMPAAGASPELPDGSALPTGRGIMPITATPEIFAAPTGTERVAAPQVWPSATRPAWLCSNIPSGTVCLPRATAPAAWLAATAIDLAAATAGSRCGAEPATTTR